MTDLDRQRTPVANPAPRILVVDDATDQRSLLAGSLESRGYRVTQAADGIELLSRMGFGSQPADEPYDLVILDIRMPIVDGLHVLGLLRSLPDMPPVIAISAFGSFGALERAKKLGAIATFDKPFSLRELREAVAAILAQQPHVGRSRPG